ncbi:extracellular protein [Lactobacillus selangorensis]|uniref:Extracellular protein n=1 Tax=Lactobacillus selangorensis TaxID=81857 RepID=A0A0R2FWB4_9LACO|nr:DUF1002 domain-containing protein [Lactobacillus selangorensis]KRN28965.1 extracellular protein [Lactobacillus selangorensis]KRN32625.1 extracellular protein [Lactobacillus selangorensis]
MKRRKILLYLALLVPLFFWVQQTTPVAAADDDWTPVATLGVTLTDSQKQQTLSTLTAPLNNASYTTLTVDGNTLVKYLNSTGDNFTSSSNVYSSALVQKTSSGSGINVKILDYNGKNNITTITADQYKNAALTAGVTDANIYVTSAVPIDGSGALAGVYAAFAKNGDTLSSSQISAGQSELNTLSDITQANKDKDGYSDAQLNNAVAGAKEEMAKKGSNITVNQITTIVNNQLTQNNLTNVITSTQKQQIINILVKVRDSGALKSNSFQDQASNVASNIKSGAKNIFSHLNTAQNQNFIQRLWAQILSFFQSIISWITSLL